MRDDRALLLNEEIPAWTAMTGEPSLAVWHQPVMVDAVLSFLHPQPGRVIVDATVGSGGHALSLLPHLLPDGRLVAVDRDADALARAHERLVEFEPSVAFLHGNHRQLPELLTRLGISRVDGILLDLGVSSLQLDAAGRGFSFLREGPLDMRMDRTQDLTAERLINTRSAQELAEILERFADERHARRIAARIVDARRTQPLTTTIQLARVVIDAIPVRARHGRLHAATRTFQALRMAVNDEVGALETFLGALPTLLNPCGRVVILTFQSLDDRLVKRAFRDGATAGQWTVLTKKPVRPSAAETTHNSRARSAKLRAIEFRP